MLIELPKGDQRPVYRQIADELQRTVAVGILKAGDALPSARQLAADLKVNPNTIHHAYRTLVDEGIIEMRRGRGAFVRSTPRDPRQNPAVIARQIAERAIREAFRHGLLASDLMKALEEVGPKPPPGRKE